MNDKQLLHYRLTAKIGAGGMGEVYRATDTKLGRDVAVKVLPADFSRDPQSLTRFEREAKALAALNHPHIAAIYGFEADQETHFIVLELVEGETLAERLRLGPLPMREALMVGCQIAEALQEAHVKGIVHRDLKPGNVKITPNGRVKVLDFGLAKMEQAVRGAPANPPTSAADTPTLQTDTTVPGSVMGTPAYMSPEQARGQEVDKRTDVWAFGCCLYECLAGRKPFAGQTASDLVAEVLKSQPDWSQLPPETPPEVLTLLRRCLEKDPARRLSSMGDIGLTLEETGSSMAGSSVTPPSRTQSAPSSSSASSPSSRKSLLPLATGAFILCLGAGIYFWNRTGSDRQTSANPIPVKTPAVSPARAPASDQNSVAVLAFANLSDDKSGEYFSDGISEELLNVLAKVPGLKVSARTSAFSFKGKEVPIPEIAQKLGVAYVVEGSVRKFGNRVRITAQLIKAADGFHIWSDNFDRELKDIFAVQDEIAGIIAKNLSLKLGVAGNPKTAVNPEVLALYFQGRQLWNLRSAEALQRMESFMTRALELEPGFAPAEAGLAQVWVTRAFIRATAARYLEKELAQVDAHAQRAIELDPTSAEAFEALGTAALIRGRLAEADGAYLKAVAANPNYPSGWNKYGWLLERQGHVDKAFEKYSLAQELDPLVWSIHDGISRGRLQLQRYAEAEKSFTEEETLSVVAPPTVANHSIALLMLGRTEEAKAKARQVTQGRLPGNWDPGLETWCRALGAWVLAECGERPEATALTERLRTGPEGQRFAAGFALLALGREEEAFAALSGFPQQFVGYIWLLTQRHPQLADDPRFAQLLDNLAASDGYRVMRETLSRLEKTPAHHK